MGKYEANFRKRALPVAIRSYFARASAATSIAVDGTYSQVSSGAPAYDGRDGLILEASAVNLLLRSQEFDNASWTKTRTNVTANAAVSPDGAATADKLYDDSTAAATHKMRQPYTKAASAITYTFSVFLKAAERSYAVIYVTEATEASGVRVGVDLATGALVGSGSAFGSGWTAVAAAISPVGGGWYRASITATSDSNTTINSWVALSNSALSSPPSYDGDGASGIYVWGAQLEANAFPTSYIPTTTATVTRGAAYIGNVPLDELGLIEKTNGYSFQLVFEAAAARGTVASGRIFQIRTSAEDRLELSFNYATGSAAWIRYNGGSTYVNEAAAALPSFSAGDVLNIRGSWGSADGLIVVNNSVVGTQTHADVKADAPNPMIVAAINCRLAGGGYAPTAHSWGTYRGLAIYDYALTQAELEALEADAFDLEPGIIRSPIRSVFRSPIRSVIRS